MWLKKPTKTMPGPSDFLKAKVLNIVNKLNVTGTE
jgi:hypothetical protein